MATLDRLGDALAAVAPRLSDADLDTWAAALSISLTKSDTANPRRVAAFLGQTAVESGGYTTLSENLSYSAVRLNQVWPARFPTLLSATPYARNPERLANKTYAGRLGNGSESTGDGWLFRGRGLIQLTGRANYQAFATACGKPLADTVAYLETHEGASAAACWFWSTRRLNALADGWQITAISKAINGGTNALSQRIALSNAALAALS